MLKGILHLLVDKFLVDSPVFLRESHHAVAEQRHLVLRPPLNAIGHA